MQWYIYFLSGLSCLGQKTILLKKYIFFAHENIKKRASKVAHNRPQTFFFHSTAQRPKPAHNGFFILWICPTTQLSPYLWVYCTIIYTVLGFQYHYCSLLHIPNAQGISDATANAVFYTVFHQGTTLITDISYRFG